MNKPKIRGKKKIANSQVNHDSYKNNTDAKLHKDKINFFVLSFLSVFVILIFYGIILLTEQTKFKIDTSNMPNNAPSCVSGETRSCSVNSCVGIQTCNDGVFSSCSWKQTCTPNEIVPCVVNGCAVAYKTCNICGTSFSNCKLY